MFHVNEFKRNMKSWAREHPEGNEEQFMDYCDSQVDPEYYATHGWLLEQARSWFRYVESCRKTYDDPHHDDENMS
ncbi:MAG: hypothetical protein AB8C84_10225 [Oligoflexales bacterium]